MQKVKKESPQQKSMHFGGFTVWNAEGEVSHDLHTSLISNYCTKLSFCIPVCFGHLL